MERLDKSNYKLLNGTYQNNPDSSQISLWQSIVLNTNKKNKVRDNSPEGLVQIKFTNKNKVDLYLLINSKIVDNKSFKGEFINDLFILKKQKQGMGFIPVIWVYREKVAGLGLMQNRDLIIGTDTAGALLVGIIPLMGSPSGGNWEPKIYPHSFP